MKSNARKWLPRRDVPTSRRSHVAMFPTSRRSHVTTFPTSRRWVNQYRVNNLKRRDVSTSRRLNFATFQRRDVSSRSAPHHLKYAGLRNQRGDREAYKREHGIPEQSDTYFEEVPEICSVSQFLDIRMMFLILNIFIFSFSMF